MNHPKKARQYLSIICIAILLISHQFTGARDWPEGPNPPADAYGEMHRFVFFSVLEGCYTSGLTNEDLDLIIPKNENGHRQMKVNFVLNCPLCAPAFDAFSLYSIRGHMTQPAKITRYTTFGPGLDQDVKERLTKPGESCRSAIQDLIQKRVETKIEKLRLNEEETKVLREKFAKGREQGEKALSMYQKGSNGDSLTENYKDWKECPICSGASPMKAGQKD